MTQIKRPRMIATLWLALACAFEVPADAASPSFYEGKAVTILIPSAPGGGYDLYGRLLMRHMGKHLPGKPKVIVENMDGAGGLIAANHLYNLGLVLGNWAENYLYISTARYGASWLLRPLVMPILVLTVAAIFYPMWRKRVRSPEPGSTA